MSIVTPRGRVSFASVWATEVFDGEDTGKYGLTLIFPKDADLSELKKAATAAALEKWPAGPPSSMRSPFRECSDRDGVAGYENGGSYVKFSSKTSPAIVGANPSDVITEVSGRFYSGCWARVSCRAYAYDKKGNKGVAFGLLNVQKLGDDDALGGGRSNPSDDFGDGFGDSFEDGGAAADGDMFA